MRFSKLFVSTTKEAPKDAILPSHIYLVRGGFISQIGSGIYNFLPLGKIVLDKIRAIVKEELNAVDAQEVQLGFITPMELWNESGRSEQFGKELLRFKDRKNNEFVLGPTHEEAMVDLVRNRVKSYKQLPLNLYQINTKFRDEARPRYGLLRGREFLMKDGYSFHVDKTDMKREYSLMEETYSKIFTRLGLDFRAVEADSGAIGGSGSKEFMALAKNGEDDIVICDSCGYGANIEAAVSAKREYSGEEVEMSRGKFHTPNITTIDELSDFFKVDAHFLLKAVAKKAIYSDKEEIVLFFVRGDAELQETKAQNSLDALDLVDASEDELKEINLEVGFIGPDAEGIKKIFDSSLKDDKSMICGANEKDYHLIGYDISSKDFKYDDLTSVKEGDICKNCGGNLSITRGIELGHIFQLGTKYSEALDATFLDQNGKKQPFVMGTYGVGVSRLVASIIEQHHDDKGCIWTKETAPFQLDIIVSNIKDNEQREFANDLYDKLIIENKEIILDDRAERFGFKIKDFELIGFPYAVIVGKGLKDGVVQLVDRKTLEKTEYLKDELFERLMEII